MEALCWAHRIEQPFAGGSAGEAAEDGRVKGCDGSIHIGIVHLWGKGAVVSTCMQARVATDRSTFGIVHLPVTEGNQHSSATIRHAIRHAIRVQSAHLRQQACNQACNQACHQACNQPTLGSRRAIRHAIRHAMACHQACNQPTLGSRHWSASLVSARWGWNETRRGEHLQGGASVAISMPG
jgi:hypothetical protein